MPWSHTEGKEAYVHPFLISVLNGVDGQSHTLADLPQEKGPGTHRRSCMGPGLVWTIVQRWKSLNPPEFELRTIQLVASHLQPALSRPISWKGGYLNMAVGAYLPILFQNSSIQFISFLLLQPKCKNFCSNNFWTNAN